MKRGLHKQKLSGSEGRKRKKKQEKESEKSSKFMTAFLKKGEEVAGTSEVTVSDETEQQSDIGERIAACVSDSDEHELPGDTGEHDFPAESSNVDKIQIPDVISHHDIGFLAFDQTSGNAIVSHDLRTELVQRGSIFFQNRDGPFQMTNNRAMTPSWFKRRLGKGQGEEVLRSWLVYSPKKHSAFCFCCLLFPRNPQSATTNRSALLSENGFSKWKSPEKVQSHENSKDHRLSFTAWKEMERVLAANEGLIDAKLQAQIASERDRWRQILHRVLHCIRFLANQNLAFRGHDEHLEGSDDRNVGNFLGLLKLLGEFDPVVRQHLEHVEEHPGSVSYLSPDIQNEFIQLLASTLRNSLLEKIRKAKYYGLMFDATPDIAHREQMSEVVRYVDIDFEQRSVKVKETFLGFIQMQQKDAKTTAEVICQQLEKDGMPLEDCRSQCYDNAAVMSGHKSGVQKRISEKNDKIIFVNCDNHSLNLAGVHAASEDAVTTTFFGTIEAIYVFFSRSTLRWQDLKDALHIVMKAESETRWSSRANAVKAICDQINDLVSLLEKMSADARQTADTRSEADQLLQRVLTFDFLVLLGFWNTILGPLDRVQKRLQDPTMNFHDAARDLEALQKHFAENRDEICDDSLHSAVRICEEWGITQERRVRRKKRMPGETAQDAGLSAKQEIMRLMKGSIDRLLTELEERFTRLDELNKKFGFLLNVRELLTESETNDSIIQEGCNRISDFYNTDLDAKEIYNEVTDCRMLLKSRANTNISNAVDLLEFIVQYGDENVFPNLRVAIQIMLTVAISIASCERSFSKLKLILSYLRATMSQSRLSALALLSIEREEANNVNFDHVIDLFADAKARKVQL